MTDTFYEGETETPNPNGFYQGEEIAAFESFEHDSQQLFEEPQQAFENEQQHFESFEHDSQQLFEEPQQAFEEPQQPNDGFENFQDGDLSTQQQLFNQQVNQDLEPVEVPVRRCKNTTGRYIYSVFHTIMALVAIYLSFRCNKEFKWTSFIIALFFPYIYIIYILATEGSCGILESACVTNTGAGVANTARSMLNLAMTNGGPKLVA